MSDTLPVRCVFVSASMRVILVSTLNVCMFVYVFVFVCVCLFERVLCFPAGGRHPLSGGRDIDVLFILFSPHIYYIFFMNQKF